MIINLDPPLPKYSPVKLAPQESIQFEKGPGQNHLERSRGNLTTWDRQPKQVWAYWLIHESQPLTFHDTKAGSCCPYNIARQTPLITFPMVLPMGWVESPPTFCMVTETIADLVNAKIAQDYIPGLYHCHKAMADTMPEPPIMIKCLQYTSDQHTGTGMPSRHTSHLYQQKILQVPALAKLKHWNGRCW